MPPIAPLPASRLRARLDPAEVPWDNSDEAPSHTETAPPQPRALQALALGLAIDDPGYNIYLCGEPDLGRTYLVRRHLEPIAKAKPAPHDALYVFNFDEPDRPRLLMLPAGEGKRLQDEMSEMVDALRQELPAAFERDDYILRRREIIETFRASREDLVNHMEQEAADKGFNLHMDEEGALTIYPLLEGKVLSEDDFDRLEPKERGVLKRQSDALLSAVSEMLRTFGKEEQGFRLREGDLDKEFAEAVLDELLTPLAARWAEAHPQAGLEEHFKGMRKDVLKHLDQLAPRDAFAAGAEPGPHGAAGAAAGAAPGAGPELRLSDASPDDVLYRYEVHLFVDNANIEGAPVVVEDHPTVRNLLGCIEREAEMGALITDFTLIKAGSLHRAAGGYLILRVDDLLEHQSSWEGLMRALRSGKARIEDDEGHEQVKTKTLEPEPMAVTCKVILVGDHEAYELLLEHEDRFPKLFKIKAHLQDVAPRTPENVRAYCESLVRIIREAKLRPFDRAALAGLVDYASLLADNQRKLSLKLPLARELMLEADALARMRDAPRVTGTLLAEAKYAKDYRANLYEEEFLEEYDRELIKVATSGAAVGRVNGLSVTWFGDYEFGLPHQIACSVGVGDEGVIDLEREADLGGPIHTKATMILMGYLMDRFAQNKPLVLSGSLCFEQSYAHVEGDSASAAELVALLSALAEVPVNLSYAFTGAVSQSGAILAVGGVTRKVEGFFQVCQRRGLTGRQGVLAPRDNVDHLMVRDDVARAVEAGQFHVYPVQDIAEALEILTGLPAGERLPSGEFTPDSIFDKVNRRFSALAELARETLVRRR